MPTPQRSSLHRAAGASGSSGYGFDCRSFRQRELRRTERREEVRLCIRQRLRPLADARFQRVVSYFPAAVRVHEVPFAYAETNTTVRAMPVPMNDYWLLRNALPRLLHVEGDGAEMRAGLAGVKFSSTSITSPEKTAPVQISSFSSILLLLKYLVLMSLASHPSSAPASTEGRFELVDKYGSSFVSAS